MTGRRPEPGLVLLHDLSDLYLQASDNMLGWEMLAQNAQAHHERELLTLTEVCHPQNLRQFRWANTMIKTQSPQILASL
ncbi:MAG: molybdopterin dinucleotide binding protein [Jatrophihabitans sp.]|nr:molybdopterin dinucleotide binding protein [Jatrophihabitans sp.]